MMNRLAAFLLAAGLLAQFHSVYQQTHEPVLPLVETRAPQPQFDVRPAGRLEVTPIAQRASHSSGQASVAGAINFLTGKNLDDDDINDKYGYELLRALREECAPAGMNWVDGGEIGPAKWELLERKILSEHTPVVLALNGPEFSVNGRGHIVLLCGLDGDKVTFADPATGTIRTTTRQNINHAPQHPDGNFIFYAERMESP